MSGVPVLYKVARYFPSAQRCARNDQGGWHLQSPLVSVIPDSLKHYIPHWLDDALLLTPTMDGLLQAIVPLFKLCVEYNSKLHPINRTLFATSIRLCDRLLSAHDICYELRR